MKMPSKSYVYKHMFEDGEVFYIGRGTGGRAFQVKGRNKTWNEITKGREVFVEIIQDNMERIDAAILEEDLIKSLQPKANIDFTRNYRTPASIENRRRVVSRRSFEWRNIINQRKKHE